RGAAQSVDHDGAGAGRRQEGRRGRQVRRGGARGTARRGAGESLDRTGGGRNQALARRRHSLTSGAGKRVRVNRRNVLRYLAATAAAGLVPRVAPAADADLYAIGRFGNVRLIHLTDTHAQLEPVFFR